VENPQIQYSDWMLGDILVFDVSNAKIREKLDMTFLTDFEQGLVQTVDWAREFFAKGAGRV